MGKGALSAVLLVMVAATVAAAAFATTRKRPDLVVNRLSNPPGALTQDFTVRIRVSNIGKGRAHASRTLVYLSTDSSLSGEDVRVGSALFGALSPGQHLWRKASITIPTGTKAGNYFLIACADGTHRIGEKKETNNCRSSPTSGRLACIAGDTDCDGWLPPADCNNNNPAIHPGAPDMPDLNFVDSNCDGIDGNASRAIFVSPTGDDLAAGTKAQPKRTLADAVLTAAHFNEDVYVMSGVYSEALNVSSGVSVYGGYGTNWSRSLSNVTQITGATDPYGDVQAAEANGVNAATTLQLLTLSAGSAAAPGRSSYGLRGEYDHGLVLQRVTVHAGNGAAGSPGLNGAKAANGGDGQTALSCNQYGAAGTSPIGHPGGKGGKGGGGGNGAAAQDGAQGQLTSPDVWGNQGGAGGTAGTNGSSYTAGTSGWPGDNGVFLGNGVAELNGVPAFGQNTTNYDLGSGFWISHPGDRGENGSAGHGGGGGGGGGGDSGGFDCGGAGGGGGGGAQGGGGGGGGDGGGGSFGIFLVFSSGASIQDSRISSANGGAGGAGGAGSWGGTGGSYGFGGSALNSAAHGGAGGSGGNGGRGGDGGGGAGGPSIAIYGLTASDAPGTSVSAGLGGAGGPGGYGAGFGGPPGADGLSEGYLQGN